MFKDYYVIDAHCHIYPEKIASKAVAGTDNFYGVVSANKGTITDLLERGSKAGIDHFIVQSVATTPKQVKSINEFISASVKEYPDLFTGLGTLHPESEDIKADVLNLLSLRDLGTAKSGLREGVLGSHGMTMSEMLSSVLHGDWQLLSSSVPSSAL